MKTIWKIILNAVLFLAFISLAIFSLVEYRGDKVGEVLKEDKLPIAKEAFLLLGKFFTYVEGASPLQLLPVVVDDLKQETKVLVNIDNKDINDAISKTNIQEEIASIKALKTNTSTVNIDFSEVINRLKDRLTKDWSRP
jgi:hypothetical protein